MYLFAESLYWAKAWEMKRKDYDSYNFIYEILQLLDIFLICLLMIIVSKTWMTIWLISKDNVNAK